MPHSVILQLGDSSVNPHVESDSLILLSHSCNCTKNKVVLIRHHSDQCRGLEKLLHKRLQFDSWEFSPHSLSGEDYRMSDQLNLTRMLNYSTKAMIMESSAVILLKFYHTCYYRYGPLPGSNSTVT